jgi:hypothetical protein
MRKQSPKRLDFEIDKLTNSIENILTGEIFETEIVRLTSDDMSILASDEWLFDWVKEFMMGHEVYRLMIHGNTIIQGLISLEDRPDHIFIYLIESASFNKGKSKLFHGVAGNLVAFACRCAFEREFEGFVVFEAKSRLIKHYENSLGAKRMYGQRMFIDRNASISLIQRYFKDFFDARL